MTQENRIDPEIYQYMGGKDNNTSFVESQIDMTEELEKLRAELLGMEWVEAEAMYKPSKNKIPLMNEPGVNAVMSTLTPRISKIFSLSKLDDDDIRKMACEYEKGLAIQIARHWHDYGVPDFEIASPIVNMCGNMNFSTMKKGEGGWEGSGIRGQTSSQEVHQFIEEKRPPEKKPFAFPFGGKK